ncbi:MAG: hypothetical protein ACXAC7_21345 [Candidatus Hodarchaeales archaeon]|jgi:hypothetical protein
MKFLDSYPQPEIYNDEFQSLFIFGGVKFKSSQSANHEIVKDVVEIIEEIAPIAEDTFRIDLTSWYEDDRVISVIAPVYPRNRTPLTKKIEPQLPFYSTIQILKSQILRGIMDGRHTAFGLQPDKQQLLYLHTLEVMNPSFPSFLAELKLKILQLATNSGKLHMISHPRQITVTGVIDITQLPQENKDSKFIYL